MTIKDLAIKTGYSVGTVSRALNDHPNVSEKARKEILEAADKCGFQPNINAKQLKQQRSTSILVVVKGTQNELFGKLVENIQNLIAPTPYQLVVDYEDEDNNEVLAGARLCREKKPLGIMFLGGNSKNFVESFGSIDVPCVLVTGDASKLNFNNLSSVSTDDFKAAECAIDTLIKRGHSKIAIIGGTRDISDTSRLRYEGCISAFKAHGIEFDPLTYYHSGRFSYHDGYHATLALIEQPCDFTAIFAIADVMAIGAIRALRERGLNVPQDVSVMGVDGLPLGDYLVPQLATIGQKAGTMARRSVEILLDSIENGASSRHETVPFTLKCRESIRSISK